jgi:lycopene cyclase domain-containing protein
MSLYLIINILIIAVPLALSFESKISFYKRLKAFFFSIMIVSSIYIVWDAIATIRGDWGFNDNYLLGIRFFSLPLEEILFFITVPYSCIFIYETVNLYIKNKQIRIHPYLFISTALILFVSAIIYYEQYYTITVLLFSSIFIITSLLFNKDLIQSSNFWYTVIITFIPFLVVNYILTSLPIVWYNQSAIWGTRFLTIPYEDFFYSFSMISWWIFFYNFGKKKYKV